MPGVAGYISGVQYKLFGGTNWVRNVLLTATLFCGPLLVVFSFLNTVAIVYRVRRSWWVLTKIGVNCMHGRAPRRIAGHADIVRVLLSNANRSCSCLR
jgi:hypothetical protein